MDRHLLYLRGVHGNVFATRLPDETIIPWRPLTMGEYLEYQSLLKIGNPPPVVVDDEIFKKCVLDEPSVQNIDQLKAGTVATVAATIMAYSGPSSVSEMNQLLTGNREKAGQMIHALVPYISWAFPAYKPEDIYAMDYTTLLLRTAQAERKLMESGLVNTPLEFIGPEEEAPPSEEATQQIQAEARRKKNSEMIDKYWENQGIKTPDSMKQARVQAREQIVDHPSPPPLSIASEERTIITTADIGEHRSAMTANELDPLAVHNFVKETSGVYDNYVQQLKEGKELKILTDEERIAAALIRMEANKKANAERFAKVKEERKAELPKLMKAREEARKRKEKKQRSRRR